MNKRLYRTAFICTTLFMSLQASSAPGIDFSGGAGMLHLSASGTVKDYTQVAGFVPVNWPVGQEGFLVVDQDTMPYLWASVETAAPLIPNVRVDYWRYHDSARASNTLEIGSTGQAMSIENSELTAYYSPINNWLKLDVGMQLRAFKARVSVDDLAPSLRVVDASADAILPALYAQASFEMPASGFRFGVSFSGMGIGDDTFSDGQARLSWRGDWLGVELGYRQLDMKLNEGPYRFDLQLDGPFAGFTATF